MPGLLKVEKCALLKASLVIGILPVEVGYRYCMVQEHSNTSVMHDFGDTAPFLSAKLFISLLAVVLLGIGTGYLLSRSHIKTGLPVVDKTLRSSSVSVGKTYGSDDTATFKDTAEGVLKEGGIEGEGQFHLERPGGESQNVYLTSSLVDLSLFVDREIKVWGQTQTAQKAGWLMDAGRVEVIK